MQNNIDSERGLRRCISCNEWKPLSEFYKQKRHAKYILRPYCKSCDKAKVIARQKANPQAGYEYNRRWRAEHPELVRAQKRRARLKLSTEERRARGRRKTLRTYGVDPEWYNAKLAEQKGGCAICGRPPGKKSLHVDHSHVDQQLRGLLCVRCNMGVGRIEANPDWFKKALAYLASYARAPRDTAGANPLRFGRSEAVDLFQFNLHG